MSKSCAVGNNADLPASHGDGEGCRELLGEGHLAKLRYLEYTKVDGMWLWVEKSVFSLLSVCHRAPICCLLPADNR